MGKRKANKGKKQEQKIKPQNQKDDKKGWLSMAKWIVPILIITLVAYAPIFSEEKTFTNWDDVEYVTEQPLIQELNSENISKIFDTETQVMLNYHPLTMISLGIDYSKGYDEFDKTVSIAPFVRSNIILHLLNTILVFVFLYLLSGKKPWVGAIAAVLFAVHPMHVESVAWISARKDLLYCFFFLLSCISYLKYLDGRKTQWLGITFLLFIAACLSKAMAVPLPFVLLLIDIYKKQKINGRLILEKLPFIVFAIWIGYLTIGHQQTAIGDFEAYSFGQRILFAFYGFCMYLFKLFVPVSLSAIYPYPDVQNGLPVIYYVTALLAPALLLGTGYLFLKKKSEHSNNVFWGVGFYLLMILLVIQFVSVGQAIAADRYTYVAYIGPLFIIAAFVNSKLQIEKYKNQVLGAAAVFVLICTSLTYSRAQVWQSSKTLWADVLKQYPYELDESQTPVLIKKKGVKTAYKNMADYYASRQQYDSAFAYYEILAKVGTKDAEVWNNLGNTYTIKSDLQSALNAFDSSVKYDPSNYETFFKRGMVYSFLKKNDEAIADILKSIELTPSYETAYSIGAKMMIESQRYEDAVALLEKAIAINANNPSFYDQIIAAYTALGNTDKVEEYKRKKP